MARSLPGTAGHHPGMDFSKRAAGRECRRRDRRGQSLVVWAIREGRQCAREVDQFLMGSSRLPR